MSDLPERFRKSSNAGEKVELFFVLAENQPEVALCQFANIWRDKANPPMRALAFQGLGRITDPHIKQALVACETDEDLQILRDIANEVKGRGTVNNDLTRWAAAWAIENMGFSQHQLEHLEGGALTDPPYRIRNEIINRKLEEIKQIQRFDSRGELTAEYERHIEFWVYGPTQELFRANIVSQNYNKIVEDVISQSGIRGIDLAVDKDCIIEGIDSKKRRWLQQVALDSVKDLFPQLENKKNEQERIYTIISHFLSNEYNHDISLRKLAAESLININWLRPSVHYRVLVICKRWNQLKTVGQPATEELESVLKKELLLSEHENDIIDDQVKAIETLCQLDFSNFDEKLKVLVKYLLHRVEKVRNIAIRMLAKHQLKLEIIDFDAIQLIEALCYEFKLDNSVYADLNVEEIKSIINFNQQKKTEILGIFKNALDAMNNISNKYDFYNLNLYEDVKNKGENYRLAIDKKLEEFKVQKEQTELAIREVSLKFDSLQKAIFYCADKSFILPVDLNFKTYSQCQETLAILTKLQSEIVSDIGKKNIEMELIFGIWSAILIVHFFVSILGSIIVFWFVDKLCFYGLGLLLIIIGAVYFLNLINLKNKHEQLNQVLEGLKKKLTNDE